MEGTDRLVRRVVQHSPHTICSLLTVSSFGFPEEGGRLKTAVGRASEGILSIPQHNSSQAEQMTGENG